MSAVAVQIPPTLALPSRLDAMGGARTWLDAHARIAGFDPVASSELQLALTEALSNVIRHSYRSADNETILLSVLVDADTLTLTVRDFGDKFYRATLRSVDLGSPQVGGYGVYFIEALMDEVEWDTSVEQGNLLRMVRLRASGPRG